MEICIFFLHTQQKKFPSETYAFWHKLYFLYQALQSFYSFPCKQPQRAFLENRLVISVPDVCVNSL